MEFKHVRKILFEQPYNFCVIIWVFLFYFFFFAGFNQSLRRESDFVLFCISN